MMRREAHRPIARRIAGIGSAIATRGDQRRDHRQAGRQPALEVTWRADADERTHHESQVKAAAVDQEPFQHVDVATQVRAPHRPGLVEVRVRTFQSLAPVEEAMTQSSDLATRHLLPDPEGARAQAAMVNGAQQVTADAEEIEYDTVDR